ncbi:MAG: hypothetical protein ACTSYO_08175 [Candidatus Ranarchaeia archaeon]
MADYGDPRKMKGMWSVTVTPGLWGTLFGAKERTYVSKNGIVWYNKDTGARCDVYRESSLENYLDGWKIRELFKGE